MFLPNHSTHNSQSFDNAHPSPPPSYLDRYPEVYLSDGSIPQVEWLYPNLLETAENELRIIEPMNHVHYHAQQTGPIITNVMQPMMIPLPHPCPPVDTKFPPTVKPTKLLKRNSMASTPNARYDLNFHGGPEEMRNQLVELGSVDGNVLKACFSKEPKVNVTSAKSREVSNSRRTCEAKFTCPFEGCNGSFTRKHNLDNHLKAHCGVTDLFCPLCDKCFTTLPVLKRHIKTCEKKQNNSEVMFLKSLTL